MPCRHVLFVVCTLLLQPWNVSSQTINLPAPAVSGAASTRSTVRATRLVESVRVDGRLDEAIYANTPPTTDFLQQEPREGTPATERTEFWVFYDARQIYIAARCWESQPDRLVANELRRDNLTVVQNDNFAFLLDTFHDGRNGLLFQTTPLGTRVEGQITNERDYNGDWNPVWDLSVGRFDGGWTVEAAIPFKSLRYAPGRDQVWGLLVRRINKAKNEISFNMPVPASRGIQGGLGASLAAALVGIEAPPAGVNLELKPYATANLSSDLTSTPQVTNHPQADLGFDVKYGITKNLTSDFTYKTDFAQVEADEQQINLTRFNLFFPEKRDFFLENQGLFGFGGAGLNGGSDTPILFYSRQIGLSNGRAVPILGGGRLTGRVGRYSVGVINIQSERDGSAASTNFSVLRVKRDILRRSSIGAIYTGRSSTPGLLDPSSRNDAAGLDGTFNLFTNLAINTYWARTRTAGVSGDGRDASSYRAQLDYQGDRYGLQLERLSVGDQFAPGIGFVRRTDIRKNYGFFRFSPRPSQSRIIRKLYYNASATYLTDGSGVLASKTLYGEFAIDFQNSDKFTVQHERSHELARASFTILSTPFQAGSYGFGVSRVGYTFGRQRRVSGTLLAEYGTFYDAHRTAISISQALLNVTPRFSLEPTYSLNYVTHLGAARTTHLAGSRITYTMTPLMFVSALTQYNSFTHTVSANVRLRWEYRPGSELFVVFNEQRDTLDGGFPGLTNRSVIVKINRLVRL